MSATRRRVIKSLASAVVGRSENSQGTQRPVYPHITNTQQKRQKSSSNQNIDRKAFVTLPGFGLTTTYMHLHTIMSRRPQPVLLMDTYDFERTWGEIVMNRGDRKTQILGMITESLYRQGFIQTIDYGAFYSSEKQCKNINRYWDALENLPASTRQRAAGQLGDGFLDHCIGEYQKPFRNVLRDWDGVIDRRTQIKGHQQKIDSGCGEPLLWNERMAAEYIAALEVRAAADEYLDLDVVGVLGQGETQGISTVLRESEIDFDNEVISLTSSEQSIKQIWRPNPDKTAYERSILDSISQVAQETTKTQHNDWYLLGSRLAVPHFPKLFVESWSNPNLQKDTEELAAESREVLSLLRHRARTNRPTHLHADAEAIAEQHGISSSGMTDEIMKQLDRAADLANYTPVLRDLSDTDQFSPASIMVAGSIIMDPNHRNNKDEAYRRAWSMKQRNGSIEPPHYIVERFLNRGGIRRGVDTHKTDWYHTAKRIRK